MPKRSDRELYPHAFAGNPYDYKTVEEMYDSIQWGKAPDNITEIDGPEDMASIGDIAKVKLEDRDLDFEEGVSYLAVGQDTNTLYIVPKLENNPIEEIPEFDPDNEDWENLGEVSETHYYSDKGNEDGYYYHTHENPLPSLWAHDSGVGIIVPAENDGEPSYAVIKEGIIG